MTIIEKIKQSVEGATGMPFLYHAAGELNELLARCNELPVAYSFLIDSGTIDDVNGRYHERVMLAVMFCDKTEFDFNALENEQIIDRMKVKAYKWLQSLRMSNALRIVAVNNTQRLYDNTTDILTGFAVNITIEDVAGVGECELPQVVIDVDKNGSYDVVGVDRVRVNVVPRLEDLEVTQNGEYLPPTDIAGFSKVSVDVQPTLEELTITANGEYTPQEGVDGFSKVTAEFDTSSLPKVKLACIKVNDECINDDGIWEGESLIDTSACKNFNQIFYLNRIVKSINASGWDTSNAVSFWETFDSCSSLTYVDATGWDISKAGTGNSLERMFSSSPIKEIKGIEDWKTSPEILVKCTNMFSGIQVEELDLSKWNIKPSAINAMFYSCNNLKKLDVSNFIMDECTNIGYAFGINSIEILDLSKWNVPKVTIALSAFYKQRAIKNLIGGKTIDYVLENNIRCLNGLKTSISFEQSTNLDRASLRALINGLADLTGQTTQTLTIGATLMAKLTNEDIAVAVSKNWTIV